MDLKPKLPPRAWIFRFKFPYPLQWGPPTFSAGHSFAMMASVLVSMTEVCMCVIKLF